MSLAAKKDNLCTLLQTAIELEWSTIPPYLTALLSIKKEANRIVANVIRSVMMEEMLHMVMVGNLISSLGGKVRLDSKNLPSYPLRLEFQGKPFKDRNFDVNLAAFSQETIQTFLKIEMPTSLIEHNLMLFELTDIEVPGVTIGDFYNRLITDIENLCKEFSETDIFTGDPKKQVGEQYYWSGVGKPVVITDLATAKNALEVVIRQGEGAGDSVVADDSDYFTKLDAVAHYFRFNEIASGRLYRSSDKPHDPPSGDVFPIDYSAVYPIKQNPRHADYAGGSKLSTLNETFNRQYSLMITQLETAFNGTPSVMFDAVLNGMRAITSIALEMMATPIENDPKGRNGTPSFEWAAPPTIY